MAIGWQIILRREDDAVLAPGTHARRAWSALVARVAKGWPVVAFHAPDTHAHVPALGTRAEVGELARRLQIGLGHLLGRAEKLEPARLKPIHDQAHLRNLFRYVLDQERHHGIAPDPFHEASALPDLMGLRVNAGWMRPVVAQHLPRVRRADLVELLGLEPRELAAADLSALADAAAAAVALPGLSGPRRLVVHARAAAVQLACPGFRTRAIAETLATPLRTVQRLSSYACDPALLRAVGDQWRLRSWVRGGGRRVGATDEG